MNWKSIDTQAIIKILPGTNATLCRTEYFKALRSDTTHARLVSPMGVIKYPENNRTAHSYSLLPPAAKNPFEKGFLDLPKLFIS